jgi:hypothetical protein
VLKSRASPRTWHSASITIDDLLLASLFIPNIGEAKNHFEYRSIYSNECGVFLGINWDKNVLQLGLLASRASATVTGAFGGTSLTSTGTLYKTSARPAPSTSWPG